MIPELNGDFLQWLRGFYYVAQTGSVRKAAQLMHRNPSTISYQLRSLEQELQIVLFDRYKKSLCITPEGEKLLKWTVSTFETLRDMRSEVCAAPGQLHGTVALSNTLPFAALMVELIADFYKKNPDVNIKIRRALTSEVVNDVESARVDFGLTGLTTFPKNSVLEELFVSRPMLVSRKDNPFKIPHEVHREDLAHLPFVTFLSDNMESMSEPFFEFDLGISSYVKNAVLSVNNYHIMLRYVAQGLGVSIMDELNIKASTSYGRYWQDIACYPLDAFLPVVHYGILVRKRKRMSPQALALIDAIRQWSGEITF